MKKHYSKPFSRVSFSHVLCLLLLLTLSRLPLHLEPMLLALLLTNHPVAATGVPPGNDGGQHKPQCLPP